MPSLARKPCRTPRTLLAFIPLMHGGGESGIIDQWLATAGREPDARRCSELGTLARVFAEVKDWS